MVRSRRPDPRATDAISGVESVAVENAGGGATTVIAYKGSGNTKKLKVKKLRARLVRVRAVDRAGNKGKWKTVESRRK